MKVGIHCRSSTVSGNLPWSRKKPSLSPASLSGALYLGLYKKRANSYILFVKYQTIKYHTLSISAYEQRERQYPRKQLLPATGQTICRLYGIRQKIRVNHQRAVYSGYHLFRSKRLHAGWDLRTPSPPRSKPSAPPSKILKLGYLSFEESKLTGESGWYASPQPEKEYVERIIPLPRRRKRRHGGIEGEQQAELVRLTDLFRNKCV
ncbi:MAG: hypothetical protein ACLT38_00815 [Akkermansia sp.]